MFSVIKVNVVSKNKLFENFYLNFVWDFFWRNFKKHFQNSFSRYLCKYSIYLFISFLQNNVFGIGFFFIFFERNDILFDFFNLCCKTFNDEISFPKISLNFFQKINYWIFFEMNFGWTFFFEILRQLVLIFSFFFSKPFFWKNFSNKIFKIYFLINFIDFFQKNVNILFENTFFLFFKEHSQFFTSSFFLKISLYDIL